MQWERGGTLFFSDKMSLPALMLQHQHKLCALGPGVRYLPHWVFVQQLKTVRFFMPPSNSNICLFLVLGKLWFVCLKGLYRRGERLLLSNSSRKGWRDDDHWVIPLSLAIIIQGPRKTNSLRKYKPLPNLSVECAGSGKNWSHLLGCSSVLYTLEHILGVL